MTLWAVAKIVGRVGKPKRQQRHQQITQFAEAIAAEAFYRLELLSAQSVSNIAWALGTLEMQDESSSRRFLVTIAERFGPELGRFPPQAISNITWALSRVQRATRVVQTFGAHAATQAADVRRSQEFSWQDMSGIATALANSRVSTVPEVQAFARHIIRMSLAHLEEIGTQSLLNITLSACRLGTCRDELHGLIQRMELRFKGRALNSLDKRQMTQLKNWCASS